MAAATTDTRSERPLAQALDARYYLDPEILEQEQRQIFERTWQLAGHVSDLPESGRYITTNAGDQPVLVLRDADGELRAFRNVCRHRGSRLLSGTGECPKAIRCRYHGWTYRLDGSLIGVPEGRQIEGLDKSTLGLFGARVEEVCGLIFVNLDPLADPLKPKLAGLTEWMERYRLPELRRFGNGAGGGSQGANWKVVADNYLEGYHIPIGHPSLMRLFDYARYSVEVHDDWAFFEAPLRDKPSDNRFERLYQRLARPMPGLPAEDHHIWRYAFIYPNTTIDFYPDQVNTWRLWPDGVASTRDQWGVFTAAGASPLTRLTQRINHKLNTSVLHEDVDLVENVQAGIATRGWRPGPLSKREAAVAWFADRIRNELEGEDE